MSTVIVGIADCRICEDPAKTLVTYALGSCIAVAIHDPVARVGGMLHFMLPQAELDRARAEQNPYMFADTGIPLLFRKAFERGADRKRLAVHLVGGAQMLDEEGIFNIGKRNCLIAKKILWKNGIMIRSEALGGMVSRTVRLEIGSGTCWLRETGEAEREMRRCADNGAEARNAFQRIDCR